MAATTVTGQHIPLDASSDADAEGEYDDEIGLHHNTALPSRPTYQSHNVEGSDADASGEEDEDMDAEGEEDVPVATMDFAADNAEDEDAEGELDEDPAVETASNRNSGDDSDADASEASSETEAEVEWEGGSDTAEEKEAEVAENNNCIFCGETEDNDPNPDFEEYLSCKVCGDNAHRQCARDANHLHSDSEAENWRCSTCRENGLEADANKDADGISNRTQNIAPKVAKELLPGGRGIVRPNSHSVFNTLILDDDPMDGSRSLRKRKSTEEADIYRPPSKRRGQSETAAAERSVSAHLSPKATRDSASVEPPVNGHNDLVEDEEGSRRSVRARRPRKADKGLCHVVSAEGISLIMSFNLDRMKMQKVLASRPRKNRQREKERRKKIPPPLMPEQEISHYPGIDAGFTRQLYAAADREQDDTKNNKPYGGILTETEANTEKTFPQETDRKRFEEARLRAEEDWKKSQAEVNANIDASRPLPKSSGPPTKIKCINFGGYEIDTWNAAPYPEEYSRNRLLYICEFCLKYMNSDYVAWRHKLKCPQKHPPGDEIYRDGKYSFFEVDGRKNPVYCQNLCLMAKLFLGSKTLYYDVEPFLFYVMTENDEFGCHFVGYFSKEKRPSSLNNVSCILVMPIYQRRGFGHMLIDFSYLLTKAERKMGSPEKPLSDMGLVSYRGYWRLTLSELLRSHTGAISVSEISDRTGMTPDDIVSALEGLRALVRDPVTKSYALRVDHAYCNEYIEKHAKKNYPKINPEALIWTPYVMNRGLTQHYEEGPTLHTVAPREDDVEEVVTKPQTDDALTGKEGGAVKPIGNSLTNGVSPHASKSHSPSHPSTPQAGNGTWTVAPLSTIAMIPPSRFEIFPPVPGLTGKRRPGRPFGSRTRQRMSYLASVSPSQRELDREQLLPNGSPTSALRRTRSMLGEEVVNGEQEDEDEEEEEEEEEDEEEDEEEEIGVDAEEAQDEEEDDEGDQDMADVDAEGEADAEGELDEEEEEEDEADEEVVAEVEEDDEEDDEEESEEDEEEEEEEPDDDDDADASVAEVEDEDEEDSDEDAEGEDD